MRHFKFVSNVKEIKCPTCAKSLLEIESGEKPFKPNALELLIRSRCPRCHKEVEIILNNSHN